MNALRATTIVLLVIFLAACNRTVGSEIAEKINLRPADTATPEPTATATAIPTWEPTPDLRPRYIVQYGDTLWTIAAQHNVPLNKLIATNRLFDPSALEVGAEIIIPITPTPTITPTAPPTPPTPHPAKTDNSPTATPTVTPTPDPRVFYTVRSGDTAWTIAALHGISVDALEAANHMNDSSLLRVGDVLLIPVTPTATSTPTTRTPTPTPTLTPAATFTPTPVPFTPPPINPPAALADWPQYLVDLINEQRFYHNLPPLHWSSVLAKAAQAHADDCAATGQCSHFTSDAADLRERLRRVGYEASWQGENWVYSQAPELALTWWYDEPPDADPHRRNLLSPHYTEIGIGIAPDNWGGYYFIADFAAPAPATP
ncbi:MAG: LysM peptidoglycan-binding domain-containing protein [Chloroflexi bacterium]|nr:LysM peptidoglycan-binding domain-containing protein [Chloroflexota bacterium]